MSFTLRSGTSALVISMPHVGTGIPEPLRADYVPRALAVEDTDWHIDRLYAFAAELGASVLQPRYSRYVIDLNRPPDDAPMYPGASNTELCPTHFFNGDKLYLPGREPGAAEKARRRELFWQPYHDALRAELGRVKAIHGHVLLWEAHSIRSRIPWLFEGALPGLNFGTADGASADPSLARAIEGVCAANPAVSYVVNGRFKGGYITRHYGAPQQGVHAVQLEMCQSLYMEEEPPFAYDERKAGEIQPWIERLVQESLAACGRVHGK
ncbi:MAG: N-formylglutamate deformylase [Ramlibacter sp.]|nr:N-formylglutamate deformylase [Ramlibacter sp.]